MGFVSGRRTLAKIAQVPRPEKPFRENDDGTDENGQADRGKRMAYVITGAGEHNEGKVAEPAEGK